MRPYFDLRKVTKSGNAIKKSGVQLQPVYEAFSNAWESIEERFHGELMRHGRIRMEFHYTT